MLPISGVYLWNSMEKKIIMLAMTNVLWESFGHHFKESFSFIYRYHNNGEKQTNIYDYCTDSRNNSLKKQIYWQCILSETQFLFTYF